LGEAYEVIWRCEFPGCIEKTIVEPKDRPPGWGWVHLKQFIDKQEEHYHSFMCPKHLDNIKGIMGR